MNCTTHSGSACPGRTGGAAAFLLLLALLFPACSRREEQQADAAAGHSASARRLAAGREYGRAMEEIRLSIGLREGAQPDSLLVPDCLFAAETSRRLMEYDSASRWYAAGIEAARALGAKRRERECVIGLAQHLNALGRHGEAIALGITASTAARFDSDSAGLYAALGIMSDGYRASGRPEEERSTLLLMAGIDSTRFGGRNAGALALSLLECDRVAAGPESSGVVLEGRRRRLAAQHDTLLLAHVYYDLGLWMEGRQQYDSAFRMMSKSLGLLGIKDDPGLQRNVLIHLAGQAFRARRYDNALRLYSDVAEKAQGDPATDLLVRMQIAAVWWTANAEKNPASDTEFTEQIGRLRDSCRQSGFRIGECFALFLLGRAADSRNELLTALKHYLTALDRLEEHAPPLIRPEHDELISCFMDAAGTGWYDAPLEIYCSARNADSAFSLLERKNLRDLTDFSSRLAYRTADPQLDRALAGLQRMRSRLELLERDRLSDFQSGAGERERFDMNYRKGMAEYGELLEEIGRIRPGYRRLMSPAAPSLGEIRDTLPENAALVEYAPLAGGLYVLVVRRDTAVIQRIPANPRHLFALAAEYRKAMGAVAPAEGGTDVRPSGPDARRVELSTILHSLLVQPALQAAGPASSLYFVLPGDFSWLPVHTLRNGALEESVPLGRSRRVSYLPSASALLFPATAGRAVARVVGLGNPGSTSWDVEYELNDVRAFYTDAVTLFDTAATLERVRAERYDLLAVCGEFVLDEEVPERSGVMLWDGSPGRHVRPLSWGKLGEVPAPAVLQLSGVGITPGSLWRYAPFVALAGGTGSVVATMWHSDRKAAKAFGELYYTALAGSMEPRVAFDRAVSAMAAREEYSDTRRWGCRYHFGR